MKRSEFMQLCAENTIEPAIALENQAVREALAERNDKRVKELIVSEF